MDSLIIRLFVVASIAAASCKTNQCQMEYIIQDGTITVTRIFISDFHLSFNKILFIFFSDGAVLPPVGGGLGGLG